MTTMFHWCVLRQQENGIAYADGVMEMEGEFYRGVFDDIKKMIAQETGWDRFTVVSITRLGELKG